MPFFSYPVYYINIIMTHHGPKVDVSRRGPIPALNELWMMEGLGMTFQPQQVPTNMSQNMRRLKKMGECGGKGVRLTWGEAKMQAAEIDFLNLKARMGQFPQKRQPDPRLLQGMPNKRFRPEYPRVIAKNVILSKIPQECLSNYKMLYP